MKPILTILACLLVLLSLAACGDDDEEGETGTPAASPTPSASSPAATTAPATTTTASPTRQDVCLPNPDPATSEMNVVEGPEPFDEVTSPVEITGFIAAFEAAFHVTIYDAQGNEIADQFAMSNEGQTLAPFSTSVPFTVTEETPACLWVYEFSVRDGSIIHVVQVPITLLP